MAAPTPGHTRGFLSRNREYIGYPERTKARLLEACTSLERDPFVQGYGCASAARMFDDS